VFRLSPTTKSGWEETILYKFTGGADGAYLEANLVLDSAGNLYGVTLGGASGWTESVFTPSRAATMARDPSG
jgi:hypothetical protein